MGKKTKKAYEDYLNDLYYGQDITEMPEGKNYAHITDTKELKEGKLGTALRKHDPTAFEVGFGEWEP